MTRDEFRITDDACLPLNFLYNYPMLNTYHLNHITDLIASIRPKLVNLRWDFAMFPELSGAEAHTAELIAWQLHNLGLDVTTGVGGHGVVGMLHGARPGPTVALRAELDALPIQDARNVPYRSQLSGVMHACGHDVHMAVALGVAEVLTALRDELPGAIKFIFQPAEESLAGARAMIAAGALADPRPEAIFAWHVFPLPAGQVGYTPGCCLAGMEEFRITLRGAGDALASLAAEVCDVLGALTTHAEPRDPAAIGETLRAMRSRGSALNEVLLLSCWPEAVDPAAPPAAFDEPGVEIRSMLGLVSATGDAQRRRARAAIAETLARILNPAGVSYDLHFTFSNPATCNAPALVCKAQPIIEALVGTENAIAFQAPYAFSHEDFALYQQEIPGALFWLGAADPAQGIDAIWHTPTFDVGEAALTVGTNVMTAILFDALAHPPM